MRFLAITLISPVLLILILCNTLVSALTLSHHHGVKLYARGPAEDWDLSKTPYIGKGPVNTRSPCPMLNTLANHGILPYSGRDITRTVLRNALNRIGLSVEVITLLVESAFALVSRKGTSGRVVDLVALQEHNKIEHDVSLSRQDYDVTGDDATLNVTLFRQVEIFLKTEGNQQYLDAKSIADARQLRLLQARRDNPKLDYGITKAGGANAESAVLLDVIGRKGRCPREFYETFFLQERFPETWRPVSPPYNSILLSGRVLEVANLQRKSKVTLDWEGRQPPKDSQ